MLNPLTYLLGQAFLELCTLKDFRMKIHDLKIFSDLFRMVSGRQKSLPSLNNRGIMQVDRIQVALGMVTKKTLNT